MLGRGFDSRRFHIMAEEPLSDKGSSFLDPGFGPGLVLKRNVFAKFISCFFLCILSNMCINIQQHILFVFLTTAKS